MHNRESMAPRLPMVAKKVSVIFTETVIGRGIDQSDPCRKVQQYWTMDGELIATCDERTTTECNSEEAGDLVKVFPLRSISETVLRALEEAKSFPSKKIHSTHDSASKAED